MSAQKAIKGETYNRSRTVDVDTLNVNVKHVTAHKSGDYYLTWNFDFTDVTQEQLLDLATRSLVIDARPQFKNCPENEIDSWDDKTFKVADMLVKQRRGKSDAQKAADLFAKLSPEEQAAIMAQYQG